MAVELGPRYARSGDVHIAYELSGNGPIDLLLVPDGMIPIEAFDEQPAFRRFDERLASFSRVIRYDRRGMGLSDPVTPSSPPTLEQWTGDAIAVLDAVGSSRTALLGMAEGGFVVTLLAATRPERVSSLVLVNATPGISAEPFRAWGLAADALDRLAGLVDDAWGELEWAIPLFAPSAVGDSRYRDWLVRSILRSLSPAMASAVFDVLFRSDIRDILASITVPTLVIHRRGNGYLTPAHGRYLADRIPNASYLEVEGDDHVPYLGDPVPILDAIEEFLTGTRRRPEVDRVLATILFTDVVASTETAARLGDQRWREVVTAYYEVARTELDRYGGRRHLRVVRRAGRGGAMRGRDRGGRPSPRDRAPSGRPHR
jgi:pimeloyl-ACP methyl ester carboxylesterase